MSLISQKQDPSATDAASRLASVMAAASLQRPGAGFKKVAHITDYNGGRMYYEFEGLQLLLHTLLPDMTVVEPPYRHLTRDSWLYELANLIPQDAKNPQHLEPTTERPMRYYRCADSAAVVGRDPRARHPHRRLADGIRDEDDKVDGQLAAGMYNVKDVMWDEIDESFRHLLAQAVIFKVDLRQDMNKVVNIMHEFFELKDKDPNWTSVFIRKCEGDANGDDGYFETILNRTSGCSGISSTRKKEDASSKRKPGPTTTASVSTWTRTSRRPTART